MENEAKMLMEELLERIERLEKQILQKTPPAKMTRADVCSLYQMSYPTLHKLMNEGKLPFKKLGRKTYFNREDVEKCFNEL